jgi:outer membrane lipoprotein SlyB
MKKIMLYVALALMAGLSGCVNKADITDDVASAALAAGLA